MVRLSSCNSTAADFLSYLSFSLSFSSTISHFPLMLLLLETSWWSELISHTSLDLINFSSTRFDWYWSSKWNFAKLNFNQPSSSYFSLLSLAFTHLLIFRCQPRNSSARRSEWVLQRRLHIERHLELHSAFFASIFFSLHSFCSFSALCPMSYMYYSSISVDFSCFQRSQKSHFHS